MKYSQDIHKLYGGVDGRQIARDARITPPDRETMVRGSFMAPLMLSRLAVGGRLRRRGGEVPDHARRWWNAIWVQQG